MAKLPWTAGLQLLPKIVRYCYLSVTACACAIISKFSKVGAVTIKFCTRFVRTDFFQNPLLKFLDPVADKTHFHHIYPDVANPGNTLHVT